MKIAVIALGGNALSSSGKVTYKDLVASINKTAQLLAELVDKKYGVIIVFGSGPQVGALLLPDFPHPTHQEA